jgi:hypothetical protein
MAQLTPTSEHLASRRWHSSIGVSLAPHIGRIHTTLTPQTTGRILIVLFGHAWMLLARIGEVDMKILTLVSVAALLMFGSTVVQAKVCTAAGHPQCTIQCPDNQGCAAGYNEPNGPCLTRCYPLKPSGQSQGTIGGVGRGISSPMGGSSDRTGGNNVRSTSSGGDRPSESRMFGRSAFGLSLGGDQIKRGTPCRSEAFDKEEAEKFCKQQLKCDVACTGAARRWICKCK